MQAIKTAVIGCGTISKVYLENIRTLFADRIDLFACADIDSARAEAYAETWNIPRAISADEVYADPAIDLVLNLTVPAAHGPVNARAVAAGKHLFCEKPFALSATQGRRILKRAAQRGVTVGCAPDTFLGTGIQTCRRLLDEGVIGRPTGAAAFFTCPGHEGWHPAPEFYYRPGGGPMLDMGPYYLTALVALLGPIASVSGMSDRAYSERGFHAGPQAGGRFPVTIDTHVSGSVRFRSGTVATVMMSFDIEVAELPRIEIYGTEGTLSLPDPNAFGGPIRLYRDGNWSEIAPDAGFADNARGLGLYEMAAAIAAGRPPLASGALGQHILEALLAFETSARSGRHMRLKSRVERPAALKLNQETV